MNELTDASEATQTKSTTSLMTRLSVMMFLQYFVQGSYLPIASVYVQDALGFTAWQVGVFGSALAVGPILAPLVLGQVVDRHFATERVMAFCHFVGGILIILLATQSNTWVVIGLGTAYSILYVPTMMLSNSLTFRHLRNSDVEFPIVRLFGTIGFVVPAYLIEFWWLRGLEGDELNAARGIAFTIAGIAGVVMSVYCISLPGTPPAKSDKHDYAPGVIISLMRRRDFLVLVLVSFFIAITHKFFIVWNSPFLRAILDSGGWTGAYEQSISSIGQICEVAVMAMLGIAISRYGFKFVLTTGAFAYALRCVLFAFVFGMDLPFAGKLTLACAGQALHGFCFACFLAAGYMYANRVAPSDVRGSMQTMYGTLVIALGFFVGGFVSGWIGSVFSTGSGDTVVQDWPKMWLSCSALAFACVFGLVCFFPGREGQARSDGEKATAAAAAAEDSE